MRNTAPRSLMFSESSDFTESWIEFTKLSKDQQSFIGFVQAIEQKINLEGSSFVVIPNEFRKKIEIHLFDLLSSLIKVEYLSNCLTSENFSILLVYVYSISREGTKIAKRKKLIKHIETILEKFCNDLIYSNIESQAFKKFEYLFIMILEVINEKADEKTKESICKCLCVLIKHAFSTFHPIYYEAFIENDLENLSASILNLVVHKDLIFFALTSLNKTFPHPKCKSTNTITNAFKHISNIIEKSGSSEQVYHTTIEKTLLTLQIFTKLKDKKNKSLELLSKELEIYFPQIFEWGCIGFLTYNTEEPCNNFLKDLRPIGKLLVFTFELFSKQVNFENNKQNSELFERLPIEMIRNVLESMSRLNLFSANLPNTIQLQAYFLQFLAEFFKSYGKKNLEEKKQNSMKESGIIKLLLRKELFIVEFGDTALLSLATLAKTNWRTLWVYLSLNKNNIKAMTNAIIESTIENCKDYSYTLRVTTWIGELDNDLALFVKDAVKEGFIRNFVVAVKNIVNELDSTSNTLFFNLLDQLFSLKALKESENFNFLQALDDKNMLYSENSRNCFKLVKKILLLDSPPSHICFKEIIKKCAAGTFLINLLEILSEAISANELCKRSFLRCGILFVLKSKINPEYLNANEFTVQLWEIIVKNIRILLVSPSSTAKNIEDIDFNSLAEYLSDKSNDRFNEEISLKCIGEVEFILYGGDFTSNSSKIRIPQVVPLVFQILTCKSDDKGLFNARVRILHQLHTELGISYLAYYNAFDVVLKYFLVTMNLEVSEFFETVITKIIPFHIPPQALMKLIKIIKETSNSKKRMILLQALEQAISNSKCPKNMLTPTHYFYFSPQSSLEFQSLTSESLIQNQVSVFLWVNPSEQPGCTLLQMASNKTIQLSIAILNKKLQVTIGNSILASSKDVPEGIWTFIGVSIKSKKAALRNKLKVSICVDSIFENIKLEDKAKFDGKALSNLVCGNNFERSHGFTGKMSTICIVYKSLSESECLSVFRYSQQNSLNFSLNNLKSDDLKIFKDLRKTLVFEWHPNLRDPQWYCKGNVIDTSIRFNGVSIFSSIKANGGLKIFLPLIDIENQVKVNVTPVINVFLKILLCTQSSEILTQEFILYAGYVLNSLNLFPELTDTLIKIVISLEEKELQAKLLKLLLLNDSIESIPAIEKAKHLKTLVPFIKNLFTCDRENLFVIYNHIKNLEVSDIENALQIATPEKLDETSKDAICMILMQMYNDKALNALEAMLNVISTRVEILSMDKFFLKGLCFLITNLDSSLQIKVVKLLLKDLDLKKLKTVGQVEEYKKIIWAIDKCLPDKCIDNSIASEIFQVFSIDYLQDSIKEALLDIITRRIKYADLDEMLEFYLNLLNEHKAQVTKYIYENSDFPDWMCETVKNNSKNQGLIDLCYSIFTLPENPLPKLKPFISSIRNTDFPLVILLSQIGKHYSEMRIILRPEAYFEFLSVIDILKHSHYNVPELYKLIELLQDFGLQHSLLSTTQPSLDASFNKVKAGVKESKENNSLKILIGIIFKGINYSGEDYFKTLHTLLRANQFFKTEQKKNIQNDVIVIEIFVKLCEAYYKNNMNWFEGYENATTLIPRISNVIDGQSEQDLRRIFDEKDLILQQSAAYSDMNQESIRINSSISSNLDISRRSLSGDNLTIKDNLKKIINTMDDFPKCLKNLEWINNVHCFLFKLFELSQKKSVTQVIDSKIDVSAVGKKVFIGDLKEFTSKYDCGWVQSFKESRALFKLHIAKSYKTYLRMLKRLKVVQESTGIKKFKVRPYFDLKNRYSLTKPCKGEEKKVVLTMSPERVFIRSFSMAYYESIIEKSGEICSPLLGSPIDEIEPEIILSEEEEQEQQFEIFPDKISSSQIIECERITIKGSYFGHLEINSTFLVYCSEGKKKPEGKYLISALEFTKLTQECKRIWESTEISQVICRRFLHQHTALEVYLKSGKSYYFNVFTREKQEEVFRCLKKWKNVEVIPIITQKIVNAYTDQWIEGKLDNFEYLLVLNKLASRSFHDLSQYPVFPWVIKDFSSDKLDLNDLSIYRNLEWPVGAQDENYREEIKQKYLMFKEDGITPFNYGSHYSSGGVVLHYLVRIEPYSHQARMLQSDCFDVADRLFISMDNSWKSCCSHNGDVKELIPELYSFPDVLLNINKHDFGTTQLGVKVHDFIPPKWAKNVWDFIRKHRKCLESPYVTENIHNWIDLIFGSKQTGKEAVDRANIFFSVSYEEDFIRAIKEKTDDSVLQGNIQQAYHFGQTPVRIFVKPHRQKKFDRTQKQSIFERYMLSEEENKKKPEKGTAKYSDQEVKHSIKIEEPGRIFALLPMSTHLLAVKWDIRNSKYMLLKIRWENQSEFGFKYKSSELEGYSIFNAENWLEYQCWKSTLPKIDIKMILDIGQYQFCIWEDKYIVSAFHTDHTFKLNTVKGELKKSVKYHCGIVTCIHSTPKLLFSGSLDSTVVAWTGDDLKLFNLYLGHGSSIRQIAANDNYQLVVSLSSSGTILMHDIRSAECLRKLAEPSIRPARVMSFSEMGVIAVAFMDKEYTQIFSINGMYWDDSRPGAEDVWCMTFNKTGEYLVTGSNKSIAFFDIFDNGNGLEKLMYQSVENTVLAIAISKDEDFLIFALNKESKSAISLLKLHNRFDSLQTIKIMEQFA